MFEIRIHGRGGQGAVTFSELVAKAAFRDGKESQAFPFFGVERRGAPIMAFARIDDKYVRLKQPVDVPDAVVVLDPTLLEAVDCLYGLKDDGIVLVNSSQPINLNTKAKVVTIDATKIALDVFGRPLVNAPMLGAFAKATEKVSLDAVVAAAKEKYAGDIGEANEKAIRRAFEEAR